MCLEGTSAGAGAATRFGRGLSGGG